ncbi:MAG: beta-ketoacyl synthase N-terminal-like domain-containing protein [Desulfobacteraceae bacterium]|nr:beta-ketoacyl synthase N-terminal-like domain-containing protein [Desulfobacteraceae bacterium]
MKRVLFLYSGEGTSHDHSRSTLIKHSKRWPEIEAIVKARLNLDLDGLWQAEIGRHRCPQSPLLTLVTQICLADLWTAWGYRPDAVIGHSIGELAAAYQAGLYSLEEVILLTHRIGAITAQLEGEMWHGRLSDEQIAGLLVHVSSINFMDGDRKHVTLSGYAEELAPVLKNHPEFVRLRLPHPWHHPDYRRFFDQVDVAPSQRITDGIFMSGVTGRFETQLDAGYWRRWLTGTVDFVAAMGAIKEQYAGEKWQIIEIGFHPVLEQCCRVFDKYSYASSMFRGEDEIRWILHQRRQLDEAVFVESLKQHLKAFKDPLDFKIALAYQGFTSITFTEMSEHLQAFFPSLAPQDFYRYKTIDQLIKGFGISQTEQEVLSTGSRKNSVVIAGMSCRFPKDVETLPQFWQMLLSRRDQVGPNPGRAGLEAGFLNDTLTRFDFKFFGIAEAEAQTMDPQQILALELTEMLWRDAGLDPQTLDRRRVGVYIGAWSQEYAGNLQSVYYPTGTNPSIIAARISYHYDLRGPSWVSNTACSSSLVALHYAAKDIEAGRVDYAIAGGVNMILDRGFSDAMRRSGFLSKNDRCKTFDDAADGYGRAEGGGLVLLVNKELANNYYAELSGSAVNQNGGRAQTLTAPHPEAQEEVIRAACQEAGIAPQQITYVECHGTGTKIGDPIEVSAIQNTVAKERAGLCYLGAVKSNLGHLESAAGMAGLIKAVLALNFGAIPPNLHLNRPNPFIDFGSHPIQVVTQQTPLDPLAYTGISSFGFGGTNAHIVVKGVAPTVRKAVQPIAIPFDRAGAPALKHTFFQEAAAVVKKETNEPAKAQTTDQDLRSLVSNLFFRLTGIEQIDKDLPLAEQGLDSMSATELISLLEEELKLELDPDLLFDYPLIDQLVGILEEKRGRSESKSKDTGAGPTREDIMARINALFFSLTSIETIDPQIALTEQGLDSMSITELVSQLEEELKIELDPDVVFEFPLIDQLVDQILTLTRQIRVN